MLGPALLRRYAVWKFEITVTPEATVHEKAQHHQTTVLRDLQHTRKANPALCRIGFATHK